MRSSRMLLVVTLAALTVTCAQAADKKLQKSQLPAAVQKAAGLLSRSCRNRRERDPDVVGKLQLAIPESRSYFLEIYC